MSTFSLFIIEAQITNYALSNNLELMMNKANDVVHDKSMFRLILGTLAIDL